MTAKSSSALRWVFAGAALLALAGCSTFSKDPTPDCPYVSILTDANRMTVYRQGGGRDLTDIAYEARFVGISGGCRYSDKIKDDTDEKGKKVRYGSVTLDVLPSFLVTPGPAAADPTAQLRYFIEVVDFFPQPEARKEFTREVALPVNRAQVDVTDSQIQITVPLTEKRLGPDVRIYLGLVLTPEQLQENRRLPQGRLRS